MKNYKALNYSEKIRWRIRISWVILLLMIVYMIVVAELGGGDSRIVTDLADMAGDIIFFGGIIYVISMIIHNRKLLKNRLLLKEQHLTEQDERNQYLHDKSGGTVMDILMLILHSDKLPFQHGRILHSPDHTGRRGPAQSRSLPLLQSINPTSSTSSPR